jgi:hypothetical protein
MAVTPEVLAALAGEDAAVYAYGVVVARLRGADRRQALAALQAHSTWRDRWALQAPDAPAPAIAYDLPVADPSRAQVRELAALVENRLVPIYAELAAASSGDTRTAAVTAAAECATRAVSWGALPQAFPQ